MEPKPPTPRRPGERAEPPPARPEREASYPTRVYPPAAGVNAFEADESPPGTSRRRGRVAGVAGLVVLALLVVAGLAAFAYDRSRDGDEQRDSAGAAATATRQAELAKNATADAILAGVATPVPTQPSASPPASPTATVLTIVAPTSAPTLPMIAVTPTRAAARPTATRTPASAAGPVSIDELLPTADEVPEGLEQLPDGERSAAEVAEVFTDPAEVAQLLDDWGWRRNVVRTFEAPEGSLPPELTSFVEISIHQFANPSSARAALDYFADELVVVNNLTEEETDPLGDEVRLLTRVGHGDNVVTVYIREGSVLIKISGFSAAGDPEADVLAVAEAVLEK